MADIDIKVDVRQLQNADKLLKQFQKTLGNTGSAMKLVNAYDQVESNLRQLNKAVNDGRISQTVFKRGLKEQEQLLRSLGHTSTTAEKKIRQLNTAIQTVGTTAKTANANYTRSTKGLNRMGVMAQQSGYQIGDFLVQVQSGTNWMVAFGQQATQVAGTLTLLGGPMLWIGTALGIAIPLITAVGAAFMRTKEEAADAAGTFDNFSKALDEVGESFDRAYSSSSRFGGSVDSINVEQMLQSFSAVGEAAAGEFAPSFVDKSVEFVRANLWTNLFLIDFRTWGEVEGEIAGERFAKAFGKEAGNPVYTEKLLSQISQAFTDLNIPILESTLLGLEADLGNATMEGKLFFRELVRSTDQAKDLQFAIDLVGAANYKAVDAVVKLREEYSEATIESLKLAGVDLEKPLSDAEEEVAKLAEKMGISVQEAIEFSGVDLASGVSDAAEVALDLAKNLGIAVNRAYKIATMSPLEAQGSTLVGGTGGPAGPGGLLPQDPNEVRNLPDFETDDPVFGKGKKISGGGGSNKLDRMQRQYQKLMDQLNEIHPAQMQYNEDLRKLQKWAEAGAISQEQYNAALEKLKERLEKNIDPLVDFKQKLEDALDPEKNYIKGLEALNNSLADFLFDPFEDGLEGMVRGFADALRRMASEAIAAAIMQKIISGIGGAGGPIASFFGFANGAAFSRGNVVPFADGGVVGGPTMFPMSNGRTGLMGEAGPEAIMPLTRSKGGKLGVKVEADSNPQPLENNIKVINIDDRQSIGQYLNSPAGEKVVLNVLRRNGYT